MLDTAVAPTEMARKVVRALCTNNDGYPDLDEVKRLVANTEGTQVNEIRDSHELVVAWCGLHGSELEAQLLNADEYGPTELQSFFDSMHADVTWEEPGPLGVFITPNTFDPSAPEALDVEAGCLLASTPESLPQLHLQGILQAGMLLDAVNGQCVEHSSWNSVMTLIKASGRPLTLRFCTSQPAKQPTVEEREAPDGMHYTKEQFLEHYGGTAEWDAATLPQPDAHLDPLLHDDHYAEADQAKEAEAEAEAAKVVASESAEAERRREEIDEGLLARIGELKEKVKSLEGELEVARSETVVAKQSAAMAKPADAAMAKKRGPSRRAAGMGNLISDTVAQRQQRGKHMPNSSKNPYGEGAVVRPIGSEQQQQQQPGCVFEDNIGGVASPNWWRLHTLLPGSITTTESGLVVVERRLGAPPPNWWRYAILELWLRQGQPSDYSSKRFMGECIDMLDRCYGGVNAALVGTKEGFGSGKPSAFGDYFLGPFSRFDSKSLEACIEDFVSFECYPIDLKRERLSGYMARSIAAGGKAGGLVAIKARDYHEAVKANPALAAPTSPSPVGSRISKLADDAEAALRRKLGLPR